jgi:capsid protein
MTMNHLDSFEVSCGAGLAEPQVRPVGNFEYDALKPEGKRKSPPARVIREDAELKGGKREKLQANSRDIAKNFSIAAWAIRRHLDYVARFSFNPITEDRGLNKELSELMEIQSEPFNCDRGGRCSREKMFRLMEASRILDGDMGMIRMRDGRTQLIESDLIKDPPEAEKSKSGESYEWVDGVQVDYAGFPRQYSVHGREKGGRTTKWQRTIPLTNFHLYGCFERTASDQVRGVSPFVTALNPLRDVYEGLNYTLVKMKISQLLALALKREADAPALDDEMPTDGNDETESETGKARTFDLSGGVTILDLDPTEDVKIVETAVPGVSFEMFMDIVIALGLKSIDIPYSFYNERFTNYSGSRTAWLHYEQACTDRRDDQIIARKRWTLWQYQRWIADGLFKLPSRKTIADLKFQWVPRGMPWWKPSEEIVGDLKAIAGGLDNPQRVCHQRDRGDVFENIDKTIAVIKYAKEQGAKELGEPLVLNFTADFGNSPAEAPPQVN